MKITVAWLKKEQACGEAVGWAESRLGEGLDLRLCIPEMDRADWLMWLLWHTKSVNIRQMVWLACLC